MEKQINTMLDIKIFVVCHKPSYVPKNPYLYPIQVGTALASNKLLGMLHDDEGDNISNKNKTYCELTAQYWAWKIWRQIIMASSIIVDIFHLIQMRIRKICGEILYMKKFQKKLYKK